MKYTIYKSLRLRVEIEADDAQDAYDAQLDMDDTDAPFQVIDCDYEVFDENNQDVTGEVSIQ